AEVLSGISLSTPMIPVVHNVHAGLESDVETIRSLLVEQIYSPVQWTRCVETMVSKGVSHVVECGPGKVLSGLNRRIDKSLTSYNIEEPSALAEALASLSA
ncbi:MAG: ACP S-malonyltransferase, partial [Halieaceae bacterium]|nr:ACP S-malonyltransferase [Halieaceae bacterium]